MNKIKSTLLMRKTAIALSLLSITVLTLAACSKKNKMYTKTEMPECLNQKIAEFSGSAGSCKAGASLNQYTFQNKTVYVFDPGHCGADMASPVVDANCNNIGNLGGFVGNTKINDEDFSNAVFVKTIWNN